MKKTRSNLDFDWSQVFKRSWESFVSKESVQKSKDGGGFKPGIKSESKQNGDFSYFYFDGKFSSTDLMEKTRTNLDFDW